MQESNGPFTRGALGSWRHTPSTMYLYSYDPVKSISFIRKKIFPFSSTSLVIFYWVCHLCQLPAMDTSWGIYCWFGVQWKQVSSVAQGPKWLFPQVGQMEGINVYIKLIYNLHALHSITWLSWSSPSSSCSAPSSYASRLPSSASRLASFESKPLLSSSSHPSSFLILRYAFPTLLFLSIGDKLLLPEELSAYC